MTRPQLIEPYDGTLGKYWHVRFIGHYATVSTVIEARDENDAVSLAADVIMDNYDWDTRHTDIEVVAEQLDEVPA